MLSRRTSPAAKTPGTLVSRAYGAALERPADLRARRQVGPGEHEAAGVARDRVAQPVRARGRADEDEEPAGLDLLLGAGVRGRPG